MGAKYDRTLRERNEARDLAIRMMVERDKLREERGQHQRRCETCRHCDSETWFPNGPDTPAVPYCDAESGTCAPGGFKEWEAKDKTRT